MNFRLTFACLLVVPAAPAQTPDEVRGLIAQLKDRSPAVRAQAGRDLAALGPKNGKAVPVLVAHLAADDEHVRQAVTSALTRVGAPAVPALTEALGSSKALARRQATLALAHIGNDARPAAPKLARLLQDDDRDVRAFAALALVRIDPENRDTLPALVKAFDASKTRDYRLSVLYAVEQLGPKAEGVLPLFARSLKDDEREVRIAAAAVVARFGPDGAGLAGELLAQARSEDVTVALSMASAVAAVAPEKGGEVVKRLAALLGAKEPETRRVAAVVLGQFGKHAATAKEALAAATKDANTDVASAARAALQRLK